MFVQILKNVMLYVVDKLFTNDDDQLPIVTLFFYSLNYFGKACSKQITTTKKMIKLVMHFAKVNQENIKKTT